MWEVPIGSFCGQNRSLWHRARQKEYTNADAGGVSVAIKNEWSCPDAGETPAQHRGQVLSVLPLFFKLSCKSRVRFASPNFKWLATVADFLKASFLSYWHVSQPRSPTYDSLCFSLLSFPRVTQCPAKMVPVGNRQWVGKGEGKRKGHGDGSYQVQLVSREASRKFLVVVLSLYQSERAPMRPTWTTDLPIVSTYILHTGEFTLHSFSVYHWMHLSIEHDVCCKLLFMDTLIRLRNYSSILNSLNSFYDKMYWISPNAIPVYIKVILWFLYFLPLI